MTIDAPVADYPPSSSVRNNFVSAFKDQVANAFTTSGLTVSPSAVKVTGMTPASTSTTTIAYQIRVPLSGL
eukprot:SAG11_NODE_19466_length_466_cov_0.604905_2_plen_70_part_01